MTRGKVGRLAVISIATALLVTASPLSAHATDDTSGADWNQTDGNAAASGWNPAETTLTPTTVGSAVELQSLSTTGDDPGPYPCDEGFGGPSVVAGQDLFRLEDYGITEFDIATGAVIRHIHLGNDAYYGDLAVADGVIFVGGSTCDSVSDPNGVFAAFDVATGKPVSGAYLAYGGSNTEIATDGQYAIVSAVEGLSSNGFVAVSTIAGGTRLWSLDITCSVSRAFVADGNVITEPCVNGGALTAYDLATGTPRWTRPGYWRPIRATNADGPGVILAVNPHQHVVEIDAATGRPVERLAGAKAILAVDDHQAYGICGSTYHHLCAYDITPPTSGRVATKVWRVDLPRGTAYYTQVADAGGVLYFPNGQALDAATGAEVARLWIDDAGNVIVANGHIIRGGTVYGLSDETAASR